MLVRLEEPMPGWVTLNTDGSSCQGIAGCGGLICGPRGRWIRGFSKVGRANAFMAELCGLFEGLKLLQTQGYQAVNVQVNLEALVKSVVGNNDGCVVGWKFIRCWVVHGGIPRSMFIERQTCVPMRWHIWLIVLWMSLWAERLFSVKLFF